MPHPSRSDRRAGQACGCRGRRRNGRSSAARRWRSSIPTITLGFAIRQLLEEPTEVPLIEERLVALDGSFIDVEVAAASAGCRGRS